MSLGLGSNVLTFYTSATLPASGAASLGGGGGLPASTSGVGGACAECMASMIWSTGVTPSVGVVATT